MLRAMVDRDHQVAEKSVDCCLTKKPVRLDNIKCIHQEKFDSTTVEGTFHATLRGSSDFPAAPCKLHTRAVAARVNVCEVMPLRS